jgi:hypothetical protein
MKTKDYKKAAEKLNDFTFSRTFLRTAKFSSLKKITHVNNFLSK